MRTKRTKYQTLTTRSMTVLTTPSPYIRTRIVYASESGTAQRYANKLNQILGERFNHTQYGSKVFRSQVMDGTTFLFLDEESEIVLFVVSTTGEGEPPRNARRYFDNCVLFHYFDHKPFEYIHYAVFGVGSKLYKDNFCAFGVQIDKMSEDLGGTRILPVEKCDTFELEKTFPVWVNKVIPKVEKICQGYDIRHVTYANESTIEYSTPNIMRTLNDMVKTFECEIETRPTDPVTPGMA